MSTQRKKSISMTMKVLDHQAEIAALRQTVEAQQKIIADLSDGLRVEREVSKVVRAQQENMLIQMAKLVESSSAIRGDVADLKGHLSLLTWLEKQLNDQGWELKLVKMRLEPEPQPSVEGKDKNNVAPIAESTFDFVVPPHQPEGGTVVFQI